MSWDPDDIATLELERDGKWPHDTWFQHIEPKCRHSLNKWNKDTGGGSGGEAAEFINCCNHNHWLGWIFALDCEAKFLSAASACGRMPAHLHVESLCDDQVSELDDDGTQSSLSLTTCASKSGSDKSIREGKTNVSNLGDLIAQIASSHAAGASTCPDTPDSPGFHFCMERAACCREETKQVENDSALLPDTKEATLGLLQKKKKHLCKMAVGAAEESKSRLKRARNREDLEDGSVQMLKSKKNSSLATILI